MGNPPARGAEWILSGLALGALVRHAERKKLMEKPSFLALSMGLTLWSLGAAKALGTDGILAVFAAGVTLDLMISSGDRAEEENVQEAFSKFFTLPIFLLLGFMLPWDGWKGLGWGGIALALGVLLLRRLPFVLILGRRLAFAHGLRDLLFIGWFGPIGVAAIFYGLLARRHTGDDRYWVVASLLVAVSILAHGATAGPLTVLYGRRKPSPSAPG